MSEFKWYCCEKCRTVGQYAIFDDGNTSFPRGEYLAHFDYLVTGIKTKDEAEQWLKDHPFKKEGK